MLTGIVVTVVTLGVTLAVMALVLIPILKRQGETRALLMSGAAGQARILQLADTGTRVNDAMQLQIALEVYPLPTEQYRGGPAPFQTMIVALIPMMAMPRVQPGQVVPVRFDPMNPARVAIDLRALGYLV